MARVNFREIQERFTHIDATFESCAISMPGDSHYAVRFYAWWENPSYLELAESGRWSLGWPAEAEKVVAVYTLGLIKACVRLRQEVIDWSFVDSPHPLLWEYETEEHVSAQFLNERGFLVAFTCGRRTVRFGNGMNHEQAEAVAQAFGSRVRSVDGFARLDDVGLGPITFGHRRSWWAIGFIYSWLTCFSVGLTLAWQNNSPQGWEHVGWIAAFVFVAWVGGGFALLPFQRHAVSVCTADLEIKRGFGPVGRTWRYDRSDIRNLRAVPVQTEDGPAEDDFELAFDSGGETVRFGLSLTRPEAEATANALTERLRLV